MNERLTVLVTGCDGQLGSELRKLVKSGCCSFCRFLFVDVNVLDICNRAEVHNYFKTNHVDVVVCDGFLGNVVLKTCESFGRHLLRWIQTEISRSPTRVIGALLAQGVFKSIKRGMDPDNVGGAPLLGLNGAVMKSHGSASERAIFNAIRLGVRAANQNINQIIIDEIAMAADALGDAIAAANSRMN